MDIREEMIAYLVEALSRLNKRNRNSLWLKETVDSGQMDCNQLIDTATMAVMKGLDQKASVTDVSVNIGRRLRQKLKLERDPLCDLAGGMIILESFVISDIVDVRRMKDRAKRQQRHPSYCLYVKNWDRYDLFFATLDSEHVYLEESPMPRPADDWVEEINDLGDSIIRHGNSEALMKIGSDEESPVKKALNKLQKTGYKINPDVFAVYKLMRKKSSGTPFKYEKETNQEARKSMEIEARMIEKLAERNLAKTFYHRYNCDFRGRIYPCTAYLNEQSSDNSKGLLKYSSQFPLGVDGAYYLAVHTANSIGEDKLPLDDRVVYVNEHMDEILSWAEDPMVNTGWVETDKAWSTLACAYEWRKINKFIEEGGNIEDFLSDLPVFIDGSNNGVQHLTALALDETTAHLVNLDITKEGAVPGDIYMYIADKVWERMEKIDADIDDETKEKMSQFVTEVRDMKIRYEAAFNDRKKRDEIYKEIVEWRTKNREASKALWATFWLRVEKRSTRRKCVKRPVMTLGYGVTRAGAREQLFDDTKGLTEDLTYKEKMWVNPAGDLVYDTCYEELPGPAAMLNLFRDLAARSNSNDEFLAWDVPVTGFPVVQAYEPTFKIPFNTTFRKNKDFNKKPLRLQLTLELKFHQLSAAMQEKMRKDHRCVSKKDQISGAAPNIVHSLDAAHLTTVVNGSNYPVTMVHDSFGCHVGNMPHMFELVRRKFIDLYETDPLMQILDQMEATHLCPQRGTLNLEDTMHSDFAFC